MSIFTRACFITLYICFMTRSMAQEPMHIKVKRPDHSICFFQEGISSDTISTNSHDLFYMKIPASMRCGVRIEVSNGMLLEIAGDSLFRLKRIINMNYIHFYTSAVYSKTRAEKDTGACRDFVTAANGVPGSYTPHLVFIRFYNSVKDSLLLTNTFYYK